MQRVGEPRKGIADSGASRTPRARSSAVASCRPLRCKTGDATIGGLPVASQAQLEEILVTATGRETNLQETPISMQAFSGEQLELGGITTGRDLGSMVPNVVLNPGTGGAQPNFYARGLPGVGIYVDGVWQGRLRFPADRCSRRFCRRGTRTSARSSILTAPSSWSPPTISSKFERTRRSSCTCQARRPTAASTGLRAVPDPRRAHRQRRDRAALRLARRPATLQCNVLRFALEPGYRDSQCAFRL